MSSDAVAALGSFLTGAGAVVGGFYTISRLRKRMQRDCDEKLALFKEGIEVGHEVHQEKSDHDHAGG